MTQNWYVIKTKNRQERIAEENLRRQSFHTFVPHMQAARHRRGKWQTQSEPMFPGYMFILVDLGSQSIAPIRSTRGVVDIVRFGGVLAKVPETLVDAMQTLDRTSSQSLEQLFQKNDKVEVVEGPFVGLKGIVRQQTGLERVVVLLELLGRHNAVTVTTHHIMPIVS